MRLSLLTGTVLTLIASAAYAQDGDRPAPPQASPHAVERPQRPEGTDHRQTMHEKWQKASPEERQKMKEEFAQKHPEAAEKMRKKHEERKAHREKWEKASPEERHKMKEEFAQKHPEAAARWKEKQAQRQAQHKQPEGVDAAKMPHGRPAEGGWSP